MRICTFSLAGEARIGVLFEDKIADLKMAYALSLDEESAAEAMDRVEAEIPDDCEEFIEDLEMNRPLAEEALEALEAHSSKKDPIRFDGLQVVYAPEEVEILPPVVPDTLFCMARNYVAHAAEMARTKVDDFKEELPLYCFLKPSTCVSGPYENVPVYPSMEKLDYELELGVLIGQGGKNIPVERAMDHVGGYTLFNDMSDRTSLNMSKFIDWYAMKAPDGFAPIGPYILLPEEGLDPHDLRLKLWVNSELRQDATTGDMVWRIAEQVSYLSGIATLRTGDIIGTGSPAGNAASWGKYLEPGDLIEGEIEHIGRQAFRIKSESPDYTPG